MSRRWQSKVENYMLHVKTQSRRLNFTYNIMQSIRWTLLPTALHRNHLSEVLASYGIRFDNRRRNPPRNDAVFTRRSVIQAELTFGHQSPLRWSKIPPLSVGVIHRREWRSIHPSFRIPGRVTLSREFPQVVTRSSKRRSQELPFGTGEPLPISHPPT